VDRLARDRDDLSLRDGALDRSRERQPLLRDLALEDGDRGGAVVVVVEARVVSGHPGDQVDLDVVVAVEEQVGALVGTVGRERRQVRARRPRLERRAQLAHADAPRAAGTHE
jgi:hypothetical protein